jgi:predicted CXXCH cytochrome family protein
MKLSTKLLVSHGVAATALLFAQLASAGTITGSAHDFSASGWSGGEVCKTCHAPHNNLNAAGSLLWNHAASTATYTLYSSPTMNATTGQPAGTSKLCLSCHDGTVAIDSFGGATGTNFVPAGANLGNALGNDHPISITYDAALVTSDGSLALVTKPVTIGSGTQTKTGTVQTMLLTADKVECASCHDVHNTYTAGTGGNLLKVSNANSALCLTCHVK